MARNTILREELKRATAELRHYYLEEFPLDGHDDDSVRADIHRQYRRMSMREFWRLSCIYERALRMGTRSYPEREPKHSLEMAVYRKGLIYYHAKKYGNDSAMLFKLSMS